MPKMGSERYPFAQWLGCSNLGGNPYGKPCSGSQDFLLKTHQSEIFVEQVQKPLVSSVKDHGFLSAALLNHASFTSSQSFRSQDLTVLQSTETS